MAQSTKSPLDQTVWIIEDGKIIETTPRQCSGYIEEVCSPYGVEPKYFHENRDLRYWTRDGQSKVLDAYDTDEQAQAALEQLYADDFWVSDINAFSTRGAAEDYLKETQE